MEWTKEIHPDWYRDIPEMHYLILGSFPPHSSKQNYPFYFPNERNRFWTILAEIAEEDLLWTKTDKAKAVQERFEIMRKLKVGVQNIGLEIERRGKSALDSNIRISKFQDIQAIIDSHPELKKILLPGYSATSSTTQSFLRYFFEKGVTISIAKPIKSETSFYVQLNKRRIDCIVLNSTSTACRIKYRDLLDQFKRNLS